MQIKKGCCRHCPFYGCERSQPKWLLVPLAGGVRTATTVNAVAAALFLLWFIVLLNRILEGVFEHLNREGGMNVSITVVSPPRPDCRAHPLPREQADSRIIAIALF